MNISRISRIALLSVVFAVPVFAEETISPTPPTGNQQQTNNPDKEAADAKAKAEADAKAKADKEAADVKAKTEATKADGNKEIAPATGDKVKETSFVDKAKNFVSAPFIFMLATAPDKIADFTYLNAGLMKLTEFSMFNKDGFFQTNAKNGKLGRGIVLAATAAAIAAVVYSKLMAEDTDMDSDDTQDFFEANEPVVDADNQ